MSSSKVPKTSANKANRNYWMPLQALAENEDNEQEMSDSDINATSSTNNNNMSIPPIKVS